IGEPKTRKGSTQTFVAKRAVSRLVKRSETCIVGNLDSYACGQMDVKFPAFFTIPFNLIFVNTIL
ncbi:MAG: hypothetical protein ACK40X_07755, partial [Armatimonadota bacterium]